MQYSVEIENTCIEEQYLPLKETYYAPLQVHTCILNMVTCFNGQKSLVICTWILLLSEKHCFSALKK